MSISKSYSFNTKITLSFVALGFIFLFILFVQIIPNMQKEQEQYKKNEIDHMIFLNKEQLKLAVEFLIYAGKARKEKVEAKLNHLVSKYDFGENLNKQVISKESKCEVYFLNEKKLSEDIQTMLKSDGLHSYLGKQNHMCPKFIKQMYFIKTLKNKKRLVLQCNPKLFKNKSVTLEQDIKKDLEKSFDLTYKDHKGKINLMWLNTKHKDFSSKPLYDISDKAYNEKYCLSKMSSSKLPKTGKLTGEQILEASGKEPIFHFLNTEENPTIYDQKAITWVKTVKDIGGGVKFLFLTTMYEKDFNRDFYAPMLKFLPAAILSFIVAIVLGFIIFKRLFKSINLLTNTASQINKGNMTQRSNLKGDDDIALLGKAFDSMLDSIEENINDLDKKVEDKTKELSASLEEKEVLLKEIHHRVKNNLAMTINLIKLQKAKIEDDKTKEVLVDIQERIFTMELLHRKLYESKDLSSISFKKYINELCEDLEETYKNFKDIKMNCEIDDINMSIEYALPCGIIITECVINAYKYAFDKNKGNIYVEFTLNKNNCSIRIGDDGVGLCEKVNINKSKTLGMRLISSIVKGQLLGSFDYKYENGSNFYINFKI